MIETFGRGTKRRIWCHHHIGSPSPGARPCSLVLSSTCQRRRPF